MWYSLPEEIKAFILSEYENTRDINVIKTQLNVDRTSANKWLKLLQGSLEKGEKIDIPIMQKTKKNLEESTFAQNYPNLVFCQIIGPRTKRPSADFNPRFDNPPASGVSEPSSAMGSPGGSSMYPSGFAPTSPWAFYQGNVPGSVPTTTMPDLQEEKMADPKNYDPRMGIAPWRTLYDGNPGRNG